MHQGGRAGSVFETGQSVSCSTCMSVALDLGFRIQPLPEQFNGCAAPAHDLAGRVFWITGLSGAGKTTIGERLCRRLRQAGRTVIFLDGDILRSAISEDLGHPVEDRRRSAMRNGRVCQMLSKQGVDVVCATISMFHEVQRWNREHISGFFDIYLRVPLTEAERRDAKGIYARARERRDFGRCRHRYRCRGARVARSSARQPWPA